MDNSEVRVLSPDDRSAWDALVLESPHGTIFHSSAWMTACADALSIQPAIYGYYQGDDIIGGCSVYSQRKFRLFVTAMSTAPLTPYGGYVFAPFKSSKVRENEKIRSTIIGGINDQMMRTFDYIRIVNSPEFTDIRPFVWNEWAPAVNYAYYFELDDGLEENLSRNVRRVVRKAQGLNVSVEKEENADLYHVLMEKTYAKQNLPMPFSRDFLLRMIDLIVSNDLGETWIARTADGEPAAAEIVVWDNKRAYRWSAALDPQFKDTGATSLLLFEIFKDLRNRGFHEVNLMAGNTPHLTQFISAFNPRLVPYYGIEKAKRARSPLNRLLKNA